MLKYVIRRLLELILVILGVTLIVFSIMHLSPIDPIRTILGDQAPQTQVEAMREEMGLNDPFMKQFADYILGVLQGDFGVSYVNRKPVGHELLTRLPITMCLALFSTLVGAVMGVPLGIISALKQNSIYDTMSSVLCLIFIGMPEFWFGLMLILLFSVKLGWLPASGWYGVQYAILPVLACGLGNSASVMRNTRANMLEVIRQDYIRTARSKGQKESIIITKHALRNALIPVITIIGIQFGHALAGSFVIETIFAIAGLGKYLVDAATVHNIPVVQGGVILVAVSYSVINLLIDLLYTVIDPRLAFATKAKKGKKAKEAKTNG